MISHKHKVIFVHIPKTGGQSVEQVFLDDMGLTWKTRAPLLLRPNRDRSMGPYTLAHLYADEYVKYGYVDQETFDGYFKFAIVRNPYDRIISEFRYRKATRKTGPFWWFIRKPWLSDFSDEARHMVPQTRFIQDANGRCLVDRVIRFETLEKDMAEVFSQIFGEARPLPKRNVSRHTSEKLNRENLNRLDAGTIRRKYHHDFRYLNYDPII